jgi:hypothetical protein
VQRRLGRPRWFDLIIGGRESQFSHLFATSVEGTDGTPHVPLCGIEPYDHGAMVLFATPDGFNERCPKCLEAQRE